MKTGDIFSKNYSERVEVLKINENSNELFVNITKQLSFNKFKQYKETWKLDETLKDIQNQTLKFRHPEMFVNFPILVSMNIDNEDEDTEWFQLWKKEWWSMVF